MSGRRVLRYLSFRCRTCGDTAYMRRQYALGRRSVPCLCGAEATRTPRASEAAEAARIRAPQDVRP